MLGKVGTAQTYHWAPPGYYLLAFFATFWPGAILAAIAVPFAWIHRRDEHVTFALAWIVPSWLVFEIVPTKLPHYVMPLYPAIAILTVMAISRHFVGPHRPFARVATVLIPFIPLGLAISSSPAPPGISTTHCRIARCRCSSCRRLRASMRGGYSSGRRFSRASGRVSPRPCFSRSAFSASASSTCVRSSCRPEWPRSPTTSRVPILESATLGYREPSLVFLVGTDLEMLESGSEASTFLKQGGCRLVFVEKRFEEEFRLANERLGQQPTLSTRVSGFNINSGRRLDIGAYAVGL